MDQQEAAQRKIEAAEAESEESLQQGRQMGGVTPSSAPNTSYETGAGDETTGFDSPATGSISLSNPEVDGPLHSDPYYPPGGADRKPGLHDERTDDAES